MLLVPCSMESTGVAGRIHVSSDYMRLLPQERWIPTGGVEVKGKGVMETYFLDWDMDALPSAAEGGP